KAHDLTGDEDSSSISDSDENEFDSMFIEDDDPAADHEDPEEKLTAELESIADATLPESDGEDDGIDLDAVVDGPEGDTPIESDAIDEDELDELIITDKA
ncbi:MAG TPA: hypothetical protein DCY62_08300, partial [Thalassospira sp.]|nr:hypothetical protein [Thalassospira sp.]